MRSVSDQPLGGSQPTEEVSHTWVGLAGPRPSTLSVLSALLVASVFTHLLIPLPGWWPYAAGVIALAGNGALAYWQAGSHRIVTVTDSGIHVLRKSRWSRECTHLLGSMPRMPLGPLGGRWCEMSIASTDIWVHRRNQPVVEAFDRQYREWFGQRIGMATAPDGGRGHQGSGLEPERTVTVRPHVDSGQPPNSDRSTSVAPSGRAFGTEG